MSIKGGDSVLSLKWQYLSSAIASFGCVCAGTVLAWTSPVLPQITSTNSTLKITESEGGIVGSLAAIGAIISALPAGYLAEKLGRRTTLRLLTVPFLLNWILIWFGDLKLIYFARFLGGFASGAICVCVPMYVSEIASVSIRGILGSFFQMSFCAGILIVNILGSILPWRELSLALVLLPIFYFIGLLFAPESTYKKLAGNEKSEEKIGLVHMIKTRKNLRSLKIALGLVAFQQLSGVNAVIFYTSGIFATTGSSFPPSMSAIIVAAVQLIASCISVMMIEKFNRRFYLLLSSLGMCLSLLLLGSYFHAKTFSSEFPGLIPLFSLILFILSFCAGFGPIPWLMLGEIFSPEFKGTGCSIATTFNWLLIFIITGAFPSVCFYLGEHITFYLFAAFNLISALFVFYQVPETRGKTTREIQDSL